MCALPTSESFLVLIRRLNAIPRLSPERERRLAELARAGSARATQALTAPALRHVAKFALRLRRRDDPDSAERLFSAGVVALMESVPKYDPERGVRFATYALHSARSAMFEEFHARLVGPKSSRTLYALRRARRALGGARTSQDEELVALVHADVSRSRRTSTKTVRAQMESLDAVFHSTDTLVTPVVSHAPSPEEEAADREQDALVRAALARLTLSPLQEAVLSERLLADEPVHGKDLGARFGCTRQNVSDAEQRVKRKLRDVLVDAGLGPRPHAHAR